MSEYIYKTFIIIDDTSVAGLSSAEKIQHASDETDYETDHQSSTTKINEVVIAETTFLIDKTYADFKALIDGTNITWGDVDEVVLHNRYVLYLLSGSTL